METTQAKLIKVALGLSVVTAVMTACFFVGIKQGQNNVNVLWQADKLKSSAALATLNQEIQQKEFGHRQETTRISDQLRKTEDQYEKAARALATEHSLRLRQSAERASIYTTLSEGGSTELGSLAGYATQLDGSLEEGRGLVAELQATLGWREDQLKLLGAQITNDRKLLDGR
jgi:hypothetical protein